MPHLRALTLIILLLAINTRNPAIAQSEKSATVIRARPLIVSVKASSSQKGNPPENALDAKASTKWATNGNGEWIQFELSQPIELSELQIGFSQGERTYRFAIHARLDGEDWNLNRSFQSNGQGSQLEAFRFKPVRCRVVRVECNGNSTNRWANIHTLAIPGIDVRLPEFSRSLSDVATINKQADEPAQATIAKDGPAKLEFTRWSGDVNVPDPVAISFDNHGRAFVTQTQRRKAQDLDIRAHREWIPDDVGFQSVSEKRAFYHRMLAPAVDGKSKGNAKIQDRNGDGSHDYKDLMILSEKIHLIEDSDGDGKADRSSVFAEDFKTEVTGIAAGVLWHDGNVYSTIAPDVWKLRDSDNDGKADQREVMATGFGLHIAYGGHDMHGLTVGPDGKIYWTVGDKGISVVSKEGRRFHYPNQGGVMRCNPDGSDFEVFAHGLRNVQELAFDKYGNLFGVDNDADQPGERERFVYIVEGMDAGWRCNYQYRGKGYNPWTNEKPWQTWHEGQPAYIIPPITYSLNGPAGFTFNPGTALSPEYKDYFFLTGAPGGEQRAFQVKQSGASFKMINEHEIGRGVPLVGINFAPDGALYGVDWGGGYPLNQKGAIWKIDVPEMAASKTRLRTQQLLAAGFRKLETTELVDFLSHPDQRVRLGSQFELVRRRATSELRTVAKINVTLISRIHAIWALGQLSRSNNPDIDVAKIRDLFNQLLLDQDPETRTQVARTISDLDEFDGARLVPLLNDPEPRVQFQAAIALRNHPHPTALPALVRLAETLKPDDTYMRHATSLGMSGVSSTVELTKLATHKSSTVRLAAVLALRHRSAHAAVQDGDVPSGLANFLNDPDKTVATEAALAVYESLAYHLDPGVPLPADAQALAASLPAVRHLVEAFVRRAIGCAFLMGNTESAERVASFAARSDAPTVLRLEALAALSDWANPELLDRVDGRRRNFLPEKRKFQSTRLTTTLARLFGDDDPSIQAAALKASISLKIQFGNEALSNLAKVVLNAKAATQLRIEALNAIVSQSYVDSKLVLRDGLASENEQLRIRSLELVSKDPTEGLSSIRNVLEKSGSLRERQLAITLLAKIGTPEADQTLAAEFSKLIAGNAFPGTELELLEMATSRGSKNLELASLVQKFEAIRTTDAGKDSAAGFSECLTGGNANTGKEIFMTHITVQCIRCHKVGKTGSTVGPNLESIALKRDARFLLRSIIAPSADIEPKYRSQTLILDSGKVVVGLPLRKDNNVTVLADAQGKEVVVKNDEIDEALEQKKSIMPEMTKALSRREIRDLVAYLLTLR